MTHLKRLVAPESWQVSKKQYKWITRPNPGPHNLEASIPLSIVVKNLLRHATTTHESKKIITAGKIHVDTVARKDYRFPLGIMDILEVPETKEAYVLLLDNYGKFKLHQVKNKAVKYCKVLGKTTLKGKKTQLNLSSGRNLLVDKDVYNIGDTISLDLKGNKIVSHLKLEKDATAYITAGKYTGHVAKILDIHKSRLAKDKITIKIANHKFETLKDYAFVVDKQFEENGSIKSNEKDKG